MKRGLRVWTRTIIGGLLVLLVVAAVACEDAEPNATVEPMLPGPLVEVTDVEVVYASRERQPPFLFTGDYDPLWGDLDTDVPIIEKLLNSIVMGTPVDLKAGTGASKREIVTIKTGWGGEEVEIEAFDGRTWLSDRSMAINIAFRDGTIWSVRQVIGCDVISEGRVTNCLAVPEHWELLHRNEVVVSTALTEWFERVEEYMPSVERYGLADRIRLGEPFSISGAGYHEGDRVELSIEFIDQSKLPLGEVLLDHGAFRWDGEFPKTAPTGYAIVSMRVFEGAEEVGGLSVSTTVARSTAAGATAPSPTPAEAEYSEADLAWWYERLVEGIHPWPLDPGEPPDEAFLSAVDYSLEVAPQASYGETVEIKLTLRNAGDEPVSFYLGGSPAYDFVVSTTDGELVWHWMCAKFALALLGNETLGPGEYLEFVGEWEQVDNRGEPVPPGVYLVRGGLNLDPPNAGPPGVVITTAEKMEVLK